MGIEPLEGKARKGGDEQSPLTERRKTRRYGLSSRNLVSAQIEEKTGEGHRTQYIFINDVSSEGLRITSETGLEPSSIVTLTLMLSGTTQIEAKVIWSREIGGSSFRIGLEFIRESAINDSGIPELLKWAHSYYGKSSFRANIPITFLVEDQETRRSLSAYVIVISPKGVELKSGFRLPENCSMSFSFTLNPGIQRITARGTVLFQRKIKPLFDEDILAEFWQAWIEFQDSDIVRGHIIEVQKLDPMLRYQVGK